MDQLEVLARLALQQMEGSEVLWMSAPKAIRVRRAMLVLRAPQAAKAIRAIAALLEIEDLAAHRAFR